MDYTYFLNKSIVITNINCNNNAINVVPDFCSVTFEVDTNTIDLTGVLLYLNNLISDYNFNIKYCLNANIITLNSYGLASHASHPELGINAISRILIILNCLFKKYKIHIDLFDFFEHYINTEFNGNLLNLNNKNDESGNLTLNVGNVFLENNILKLELNLRIPVFTKSSDIESCFDVYLKNYSNVTYKHKRFQEPLYLNKSSTLITTLCSCYNEITNSKLPPIAIGGATFARAFKNFASFGPTFPGDRDMCHQTDEFIEIDKLMLCCKLYAEAILKFGGAIDN